MASKQKKEKDAAVSIDQLIDLEVALYNKRDKMVDDLISKVKKETKDKKIKTLIKRLDANSEKLGALSKLIEKQIKAEQKRLKKEEKEKAKKEKAAKAKAKKNAAKEKKDAAKESKTKFSPKRVVAKTATQTQKKTVTRPKAQAKKTTVAKVAVKPASKTTLDSSKKSVDLNARTAIAQLRNITSMAELDRYLVGEKRTTVLSRAGSRKNALSE